MLVYHKVRGKKFKLTEPFEFNFYKKLEPRWKCKSIQNFSKCGNCNQPSCFFSSNFYCISEERVIVYAGYTWDGASGPVIFEPESSRRATLVHDVIYQSMRNGVIAYTKSSRRWADREFRKILEEDGMWLFLRWAWYFAVRIFGRRHARLELGKKC